MFAEQLAKALAGPALNAPSSAGVGVAGNVRSVISNITGMEFFGPAQPMYPVAPEGTQTRQFDYPYSWNLLYRPRSEQPGPSFEQLRMVAQAYDLVRSCVETRKDQIAKFPYDFRAIKKPGESKREQAKRTAGSTDIPKLKELFECPDGQNDFQGWIRMLMEDVLVIDAMAIEVIKEYSTDVPETQEKFKFGKEKTLRRQQTGKVVRLFPTDGATIKPLMTATGRRPLPPDPGYQQNVKGMPALNLSMDDLVYRPRNPRTNSGYGYSPVEQALMAINIGLRREVSQLSYYTSGNVPEALIAAPETWGVEEIRKMQAYFDSLEGDLQARRRVRWIPDTKSITMTKEAMLKDEFDEWLARIICFIFSLPPTPFVKQMNRAVATQVQQTALQEGLIPTLAWLAGVFNWIIHRHLGIKDVEFAWKDEEEPDKLKQAQIDKIYASYGKESVDDQRERDGQDPIGMGPAWATPQGPIMLKDFLAGEGTGLLPQGTSDAPADAQAPGHGNEQRALPPAKGKEKDDDSDLPPGDDKKKKLPPAAQKYLDKIVGGGRADRIPFSQLY
jgi:hypothetical protein